MKKVLLLGEPMTLFIATEYGKLETVRNYVTKVAGAELNVALGLKRLNYEVEYVTKLGYDPLSKMVYDFISSNNIGTKYLMYDENNNVGLMLKGKIENGDPEIAYYRKHSATYYFSEKDIENINIDDFDLIHITGISLGISEYMRKATLKLLEIAKKKGKIVTFDPNLRLKMWKNLDEMKEIMNFVSKQADVVMPGISEAKLLLDAKNIDEIIEKYNQLGIYNIVIKDGANGSYYFTKNNKYFEKGFRVSKVVDTVGAGDGFAVGIISGILENLEPNEILKRANAIGSIQVQHISDNEALPTRSELENYINKNQNNRSE